MKACTRALMTLLVGTALLVGSSGCDSTTEDPALMRVVHATPGATPIDFFIDFELFTRNLAFRSGSPYLRWDPGLRLLEASPADNRQGTSVSREILLNDQSISTVLITGAAEASQLIVLDDDRATPPAGQARLRVVHAAPGLGGVNVLMGQPDSTPDLDLNLDALGSASTFFSIDAGSYNVEARTLSGGAPATLTQTLEAGVHYLVVVTNTVAFIVADG